MCWSLPVDGLHVFLVLLVAELYVDYENQIAYFFIAA